MNDSDAQPKSATFEDLGLHPHLLRTLEDLKLTQPTPVQALSIPVVLQGKDVAVQAPTGSGKTAAYVLPILHQLLLPLSCTAVLVLVPTRELALQVASSFKSMGKYSPAAPKVMAVIGGQSIDDQIAGLQRTPGVLVATPGRLVDLMERGVIDLSRLRTLVMDEADRLLDRGFSDQLSELLDAIPTDRQTLLFSATLPMRVVALADQVLQQPVSLTVELQDDPVCIDQRVFAVPTHRRRALLQHLISKESWGSTIVFLSTQRAAENLAVKLHKAGLVVDVLHGGLSQQDRIAALNGFHANACQILLATDLAARGIDIRDLDVVVNYDLPRSPADYLHRIGRTARAGASGRAVSFVDEVTEWHFRVIEKRHNLSLPRLTEEGFEQTKPLGPKPSGPAPKKGKRPSKKDKLRARLAAQQAAKAGSVPPDVDGSSG